MDVSILCSLREGFSNVILESMASGKPVIASNVGGNPEAVVDGCTGFLFNPDNPDELATRTISLFRNKALCEQMGSASRKRAEEIFSRKTMVKMYENIYQKLLPKEITASMIATLGDDSPAPQDYRRSTNA
jgi:glycosyltransferase involved in cell wall biosynthesis